ETPRRGLHRLQITLGVADVENDLLAFFESQLLEALPEALDRLRIGAPLVDHAHAIDASWLSLDSERRGEEGDADQECPRSTGHGVDRQPHPTPARRAGIRGPPCSSPRCSAPRSAASTGWTTGATWPSPKPGI